LLNFDESCQAFKTGLMLKKVRENFGITQNELSTCLNAKESAVTRD
jgi:predicted transcriptional regulator